jgi:hypothetical protein
VVSWSVFVPIAAVSASSPSLADELTAGGTVGTCVVALIAAIVAYRQLREARRLREAQAQPYVVVDVEPSVISRRILNLVIRNTGQTLARDVTIRFDPPLRSTLDTEGFPPAKFRALVNGIPALPPGREYQIMLDSTVDRYQAKLPDRYTVTVSFRDRDGKKLEDLAYELDLAMFRSAAYVQELSVHDVAQEMQYIRKTLENLVRMTAEARQSERLRPPQKVAKRSRLRNWLKCENGDPQRHALHRHNLLYGIGSWGHVAGWLEALIISTYRGATCSGRATRAGFPPPVSLWMPIGRRSWR